jgi:hypothetical protein
VTTSLRKSPLRRSSPVKKRRAPRRSSRVRDAGYMERVRGLQCLAEMTRVTGECFGPIEAHHMGARGLGQKASDSTTCAFCHLHHMQWHSATGAFADWTREQRRDYAEAAVAYTRQVLGWKEAA